MLRIVSQPFTADNDDDAAALESAGALESGLVEAQRGLTRAVAARLPAGASFAEHERAVLAAANEVCRRTMSAVLPTRADALPERVRIDGVVYARHHVGTVAYHSLCGPLRVRRATYREVGVHNGPTVVPLDLATGLIAGATPALAYRVALGYAQGPGRHAEAQLHADHRQPPSRSTLERLGKTVGTHTHAAAPRIEAAVRDDEALPAGAHALVVGLERTTVPMEEVRSASATATTRRQARTTPYVRTAPTPVDVHYRMAYVGTVSVVDRAGDALVTRRYAIPSAADPASVTARMMADVRRARAQAPRMPVGVVQDGAPELWTLIRTALTTGTRLRHWHEAVDRYHLNERLAEVLRLVEPETPRRRTQLRHWNYQLDTDDRTIIGSPGGSRGG